MTTLIRTARPISPLATWGEPHVRRATIDDAPALQRIYSQRPVLENTSQEPLATLADFQRWIDGAGGYLLVACGSGDVLGALQLKPMTHLGMQHIGQVCRVAVDQEHQGRGVGGRLLASAVDLADKWLNLYRLELLVRADNQAAVRLYQRLGFRQEGLLRGYGYRNGEYMDCLTMARLRGPLAS